MAHRALEIGQDNIASTKPRKIVKNVAKTVRGREQVVKKTYYEMQWFINLDGRVSKHCTRTVGGTMNDCKQRARKSADRLRELAHLPGEGGWNIFAHMDAFVSKVCVAEVTENRYARPLRPQTQLRYLRCLELYREQASGMPIADAIVPAKLSAAFKAIATEHGNPTARQAAKIVSRYVLEVARNMRIIEHNPLRPLTIEVTVPEASVKPHRGQGKPKGGQALTPTDRKRVVDYLLALDPHMPARKRWSAADMTAKRATLIDMTLIQATCGLRVSEVRTLTREHVYERDGLLIIEVTAEISKTHMGREVPVFDERVARRLRDRLEHLLKAPDQPVFPAPVAGGIWDQRNCQRALAAFYDELADALSLPLLHEARTHVWRTTLNSELRDKGVPAEWRAAYFGHSVEINRRRYTDFVDFSALRAQVTAGDNA